MVDELFDLLDAVALGRAPDARAVVGHLVDPAAIGIVPFDLAHRIDAPGGVEIGRAEREIVLEEIDVPADVRHDELLVDQRIAFEQVGVRGVRVDDHLVDLGEAVLVALGELLVLHAESPVRVAVGKPAVRGDLVHLIVGQDLEDDGEEIEPVTLGDLLDLLLLGAQVLRERRLQGEFGHVTYPFPETP